LLFADAGAGVGGGHVMRCLTLADALRRRGALCAFAETPAAAEILDVFAAEDIGRVPMADGPPAELAAQFADLAGRWGADGLVVDHYGFGAVEEAALRGGVRRLMVLDDLKRAHHCDLVLDSNLDRQSGDYPGMAALIGPRFALVRAAFAARRDEALRRRSTPGSVQRVLVAMGLTDVGAITGRVVEAILPALGEVGLDVVLGRGSGSLPALEAVAARDPRVRLHIDTADMDRLTAEADLALGAGGSSVWERCCLGLPALTLVLAANQRDAARSLEDLGAALMLDGADPAFNDPLRATFEALMRDPARRAAMSAAAASLCDGRGAERVAERLLAML
jgi:UDP-2,4-diacetamido-2,4,6-trideoxy-beta-L-altropyranose hydrolase